MSSYQDYLDEKALHVFMKKMDVKIAKSIHKNLIKNMVITNKVKFGEILDKSNINSFYANSNSNSNSSGLSHNYQPDIESYNQIISRNQEHI